jgi:hypothetical protein
MKKRLVNWGKVLVFTLILTLLIGANAFNAGAATSSYIQNDSFWKDTSGNPIYAQTGNIIKAGSTYYWYGIKYNGAVTYYNNPTAKNSDNSFNCVNCYSSTDLMNWTYQGAVFTAADLGNTIVVGCSGVAYNANTGKYVMILVFDGDKAPDGGVGFATSSTPTGHFTYDHVQTAVTNVLYNVPGDNSLFIDDNGQAYMIICNRNGRTHLYVAPLNPADFLSVQPATEVYTSSTGGREGNMMFKHNGRYYLCSSDLHGYNASHTYYVSAASILGPYSAEAVMPGTDPDFSHVSQTSNAYAVGGSTGSTVIFTGMRWCCFAGNGIGYNQWCPITFSGTTPIFNSVNQWTINASTGAWSVGPDNNYAINPNFEADRVVTSTIAGWNNLNSASNLAGKQSTGNFVLYHYNAAAFSAMTHQTITVPNGTYTMKAWVKSSGGQSICRLFARDFGGTEIRYNMNTAISSWTQVTVSSAIDVTNGSVNIGLYTVGAAGQWAQVDNITLTKNSDGETPISRIQSYNFQDRYVRHSNSVGRIDPDVSPIEDSQWRVAPGLANGGSDYVSFESVNNPGYYLRHSNYNIVLAQNDGSSIFKEDATFRKVSGLADSTWTSFQSYNFPDRYIRHSNYVLKINPISTSLEKQDATFKILGN